MGSRGSSKKAEKSKGEDMNGTVITRRDLGNQRCYWSMRIYEHLKRRGKTAKSIAIELGISPQSVSRTISVKNHSTRVLDALRDSGVPEDYLFDPRCY